MGYKTQAATINNLSCNAAQESNTAHQYSHTHESVDEPVNHQVKKGSKMYTPNEQPLNFKTSS